MKFNYNTYINKTNKSRIILNIRNIYSSAHDKVVVYTEKYSTVENYTEYSSS